MPNLYNQKVILYGNILGSKWRCASHKIYTNLCFATKNNIRNFNLILLFFNFIYLSIFKIIDIFNKLNKIQSTEPNETSSM